MILDVLKKRLYRANDKAPRRWLKELQVEVWGLRTQPSPTLAPPHTSWSMAQKQYSLQILLSDHHVWRTLMKTGLMKHVNSRLTALKNDSLTLVYDNQVPSCSTQILQ
jgi:hypothetical protein